ncbi:unnamed protein product [Sphagnum troendelagicum]|uniref:Uncharacterized protein n=1 Tax=Sphagnum troendelagicum TaxID=128251 RepID=A0ABP0TJL2_9BRYO
MGSSSNSSSYICQRENSRLQGRAGVETFVEGTAWCQHRGGSRRRRMGVFVPIRFPLSQRSSPSMLPSTSLSNVTLERNKLGEEFPAESL